MRKCQECGSAVEGTQGGTSQCGACGSSRVRENHEWGIEAVIRLMAAVLFLAGLAAIAVYMTPPLRAAAQVLLTGIMDGNE